MTEIQTEKLNNIKVKPVITNGGEPSPSQIKGYNFIPLLYSNLFICAKKKSGKTNVIYTLLKHVTTPQSKVYLFASTVLKDPTYFAIKTMLKKREIEFEYHTSFIDVDGTNILADILSELGKAPESDDANGATVHDVEPPKKVTGAGRGPLFSGKLTTTPEVQEPVVHKPRKIAAELVFVFDDLGADLRHPSINQLLKTNRHYHSKVIISSQYLTDLQPQAIKQLDFAFLFKSFNDEKLRKIYELLDISVPFEEYRELYKFATASEYSFLYVDVRNESFRKNFNTGLKLESA